MNTVFKGKPSAQRRCCSNPKIIRRETVLISGHGLRIWCGQKIYWTTVVWLRRQNLRATGTTVRCFYVVREIGFQHLRFWVFSLIMVTPQIWGGELATFPLRAKQIIACVEWRAKNFHFFHSTLFRPSHFPLLFQSYGHSNERESPSDSHWLPKTCFWFLTGCPVIIISSFVQPKLLNLILNIHWHQVI